MSESHSLNELEFEAEPAGVYAGAHEVAHEVTNEVTHEVESDEKYQVGFEIDSDLVLQKNIAQVSFDVGQVLCAQ